MTSCDLITFLKVSTPIFPNTATLKARASTMNWGEGDTIQAITPQLQLLSPCIIMMFSCLSSPLASEFLNLISVRTGPSSARPKAYKMW